MRYADHLMRRVGRLRTPVECRQSRMSRAFAGSPCARRAMRRFEGGVRQMVGLSAGTRKRLSGLDVLELYIRHPPPPRPGARIGAADHAHRAVRVWGCAHPRPVTAEPKDCAHVSSRDCNPRTPASNREPQRSWVQELTYLNPKPQPEIDDLLI